MTSSADVAARAGVSRSTVSQILNGHAHRFTVETVARVREAAERMGYHPSAAGRALVRGTSDIVITLVPNITFGPRLRDYVDILTAGLATEGYTNLLRFTSEGDLFDASLLSLRPRAVVSLSQLSTGDRDRLHAQGTLTLDQTRASQERVDVAIGRRQAQHLAAAGYEVVAAAMPDELRERRFAPPRAAGVHDWCLHNGITVLPTLHIDLDSGRPTTALADLPSQPIGVAAYNDEAALALLSAAHELGRAVPTDLGIIGVDNSRLARLASPTITSVDFDLAYSAEQTLRAVLSGDRAAVDAGAASEVERRLKVVQGRSTVHAKEPAGR